MKTFFLFKLFDIVKIKYICLESNFKESIKELALLFFYEKQKCAYTARFIIPYSFPVYVYSGKRWGIMKRTV